MSFYICMTYIHDMREFTTPCIHTDNGVFAYVYEYIHVYNIYTLYA